MEMETEGKGELEWGMGAGILECVEFSHNKL